MTNESMIKQKYESISQSDYSCDNHFIANPLNQDNVEDYLNFGDDLHHGNHHILDNYENIHGIKQEDMGYDFLQTHQSKNMMEHGFGFEKNHLPFVQPQNSNMMGEAPYFVYKQQPLIQVNQSTNHTSLENTQLSAKMKRIMKREKAKSRRKQNLEQQQQLQQQNAVSESQFKPTLPLNTHQIPIQAHISQQQTTSLEEQNIVYKKQAKQSGNKQQQDMRSQSTSCSSSVHDQFEVKLETSSQPGAIGSPVHESLTPSHLLEQNLLLNGISSEELQLKVLQSSGNMDSKQQKKVMQMIRNRISAQNSRDRKKAYISKLEQDKEDTKQESVDLKEQLNKAQQDLSNEKSKNDILQKEIQELKKKLQSQCKSFNTNPSKMEQSSLSSTPFYPKHHNSLQKNYAAFSVAFFAVLGIALIFNVKPSKNELAIINQSSQMMKMLDDLQKSTTEFSKNSNEKDEISEVSSPILSNKQYQKSDLKEDISVSIEEEFNTNSMDEELQNSSTTEQPTPFDFYSKNYKDNQIQKDQWIQFLVPKQDLNQRDDISRDSAETDATDNSYKYLQVWAQIKSVNEFEQSN